MGGPSQAELGTAVVRKRIAPCHGKASPVDEQGKGKGNTMSRGAAQAARINKLEIQVLRLSNLVKAMAGMLEQQASTFKIISEAPCSKEFDGLRIVSNCAANHLAEYTANRLSELGEITQ